MSVNTLLKTIIRVSHIDTNATTVTIKHKLQNLNKFILTISCDIEKFNMHVNLLLDYLSVRGETTSDLLNYLFRAYKNATKNEFKRYVKSKRERYEEGEALSAPALMILCSNEFKLLVESDKRNAPLKKKEKILTLQSQINKLKENKKQEN